MIINLTKIFERTVYMKRRAMEELIKWKDQTFKRPLYLSGCRGVGKTYLALEFAKTYFEGNLYINFEHNSKLCNYFKMQEEQIFPSDFIEILSNYYQIPEELLGTILFILDELPSCFCAYQSFLRFSAIEQGLSVVIISSEITEHSKYLEQISKDFYFVSLYPMDFFEFLSANNLEWYTDIIKAHSINCKKVPEIVHNELITLLEDYLIVGGMPAAVNEYIHLQSTENIIEIHRLFTQSLFIQLQDVFSESDAFKMRQIFEITQYQLLKENKKFQYYMIRKGATKNMFYSAIEQLKRMNQILKCNRLLSDGRVEEELFRLYYYDVGIFNSLIQCNKTIGNVIEEHCRKAILENYIAQTLTCCQYQIYYWESKFQAKIDFIINHKEGMIPLELYLSHNMKTKSIKTFNNYFDYPYSIKISFKNFEFTNQVKYIPYYAVLCL